VIGASAVMSSGVKHLDSLSPYSILHPLTKHRRRNIVGDIVRRAFGVP
jgi:hypothetical protein